eukprot:g14563.t1
MFSPVTRPSDFRNSKAMKKARKNIFPLSAMHNVLPFIPKFFHFLLILCVETFHIAACFGLIVFCMVELIKALNAAESIAAEEAEKKGGEGKTGESQAEVDESWVGKMRRLWKFASGGAEGGVLLRPYVCYLYDIIFPSLLAGYHFVYYVTLGYLDIFHLLFDNSILNAPHLSVFLYKLLTLFAVYQAVLSAVLYFSSRAFYFLASLPPQYANPPAPGAVFLNIKMLMLHPSRGMVVYADGSYPLFLVQSLVFGFLAYGVIPYTTFTVWMLNIQQSWKQCPFYGLITAVFVGGLFAGRWWLRKPCVLELPEDGRKIKSGLDLTLAAATFFVLHFGFVENDFFYRTKNWKYIFAGTNLVWPLILLYKKRGALYQPVFDFFRAHKRWDDEVVARKWIDEAREEQKGAPPPGAHQTRSSSSEFAFLFSHAARKLGRKFLDTVIFKRSARSSAGRAGGGAEGEGSSATNASARPPTSAAKSADARRLSWQNPLSGELTTLPVIFNKRNRSSSSRAFQQKRGAPNFAGLGGAGDSAAGLYSTFARPSGGDDDNRGTNKNFYEPEGFSLRTTAAGRDALRKRAVKETLSGFLAQLTARADELGGLSEGGEANSVSSTPTASGAAYSGWSTPAGGPPPSPPGEVDGGGKKFSNSTSTFASRHAGFGKAGKIPTLQLPQIGDLKSEVESLLDALERGMDFVEEDRLDLLLEKLDSA